MGVSNGVDETKRNQGVELGSLPILIHTHMDVIAVSSLPQVFLRHATGSAFVTLFKLTLRKRNIHQLVGDFAPGGASALAVADCSQAGRWWTESKVSIETV